MPKKVDDFLPSSNVLYFLKSLVTTLYTFMTRVFKYHPRRDILLNSAHLVKVMVLSCLPRALQMFKNCLSCDEGSKPLCVSFDKKNQVSLSGGKFCE